MGAYSQQGLLLWHNYFHTMQGMLFYGRHTTGTTPQTSDYGWKTINIPPFMPKHLRHTSDITQSTSKHVTKWKSYYWRQTMDVTGTTDITTWTSYNWRNATDAKPRTSLSMTPNHGSHTTEDDPRTSYHCMWTPYQWHQIMDVIRSNVTT